MVPKAVSYAIQILVFGTVAALIAGHLLGQPVLLGFVETGSMEPTIETGDGFVSIPNELTADPEPGAVIVFDAQEIEGGGLTTHRIVEETDRGFVTHGDANPVTDQDSGEPPVQESQIVATALQVDGTVVTIPKLGTVVMTVSDAFEGVQNQLNTTFGMQATGSSGIIAYFVLGLSLVLYAAETIRERRQSSFDSPLEVEDEDWLEEVDPRWFAAGFALLVVSAMTAAMVVPAGTHSYDVISAEFASDRPLVIEQGTTQEIPYELSNQGFVPTISYVTPGSEDVAVENESTAVEPRSSEEVTVSITAPDETGYYPTFVTEYRYLHLLPASVIDALYAFHPWSPIVVINVIVGSGFYLLGRWLFGDPRPRSVHSSTHKSRRSIRRK